jgi:deazaflavin-dependent oxidoreductase (nitroreductase family)
MPEKIKDLKPPRGLARLAFRLPIWLYRLRLGWILGTRFVLLTHTGRKSGLPRRTVLEVVRYNKATGACIIASGWGTRSDWFQNITENPKITFQVRNKPTAGIAERLSSEAGGKELLDYALSHPMAFRELAKFMGFRLSGTVDDIRAAGRVLPMFMLRPEPPAA